MALSGTSVGLEIGNSHASFQNSVADVSLATTEAAALPIHHRMSHANLTLVSKWCALKQNQPTAFLLCKWFWGFCNSLFVFFSVRIFRAPKKKKLLVLAPWLDHNFYENIFFAILSWHILSGRAFMRRDAARADSKKYGLRSTTCIRPREGIKKGLHKVDK